VNVFSFLSNFAEMTLFELILLVVSALFSFAVVLTIRLNIGNILFFSYYIVIVFIWFGSIVTLYGDWWLRDVSTENVHRAFVFFHFSHIWFSIIVLLYHRIVSDRIEFAIIRNYPFAFEKVVFPLVLIMILFITAFYFIPKSALMYLITSGFDYQVLAERRGGFGYYFQGPKILLYFKNLVMNTILIYLIGYYGICHYRLRRYSNLFYLSFFTAIIVMLLDLSKAPIVILILYYFLIKYKHSEKTIRLRKYLILGTFVLIFVYSLAFGLGFFESLPRIAHRLFVSQYVGIPIAFEVFPVHHDYLGINSISGFVSKIFGGDYIPYARILMEFGNPLGTSKGTAGYMSTYFLAEGFAMSGYPTMVISIIIIPVFLACIDYVFRMTSDVFFQAYYLVLLIRIPFIIIDGFTRIFFNTELIFMFLFVLFFRLINKYFLTNGKSN